MLSLCLKCRVAAEREGWRERPGRYDCPRCGRTWTASRHSSADEWLAAIKVEVKHDV